MITEIHNQTIGEILTAVQQLPQNLVFALYVDELLEYGPNLPVTIHLLNPKRPMRRLEQSVVPSQSEMERVSDFLDGLQISGMPFAFLFRWPCQSQRTLVFEKMSMSEASSKVSDGLLYEIRQVQ